MRDFLTYRQPVRKRLLVRVASVFTSAFLLVAASSASADSYAVLPWRHWCGNWLDGLNGLDGISCVLSAIALPLQVFVRYGGGALVLAAIVIGVVLWYRRRKIRQGDAVSPKRLMHMRVTGEQVKKASVSGAIALLLPLFVQLLSRSVAPAAAPAGMNLVALWTEVVLAGVFIGAGLVSRHVRVVGYGLMFGGLFSLTYTITEHFPEFSTGIQLLISALGLLAVLSFSIAMTLRDLAARRPRATLSGLRGILVGMLVFVFSMMVIGLADNYVKEIFENFRMDYMVGWTYINAASSSGYGCTVWECGYPEPTYAFPTVTLGPLATLVLGVAYLILGVGSRAIGKHAGAALFLAGMISIIRVLLSGVAEFGQSVAAIVTGGSVLALIIFAYVKFGRSSSAPPPAPPA